MSHLTQCSICKQIVSCNSRYTTYRLLGMSWTNHNRICYPKSKELGIEFEFLRYYAK